MMGGIIKGRCRKQDDAEQNVACGSLEDIGNKRKEWNEVSAIAACHELEKTEPAAAF